MSTPELDPDPDTPKFDSRSLPQLDSRSAPKFDSRSAVEFVSSSTPKSDFKDSLNSKKELAYYSIKDLRKKVLIKRIEHLY